MGYIMIHLESFRLQLSHVIAKKGVTKARRRDLHCNRQSMSKLWGNKKRSKCTTSISFDHFVKQIRPTFPKVSASNPNTFSNFLGLV